MVQFFFLFLFSPTKQKFYMASLREDWYHPIAHALRLTKLDTNIGKSTLQTLAVSLYIDHCVHDRRLQLGHKNNKAHSQSS
jgi:hypothetical protein